MNGAVKTVMQNHNACQPTDASALSACAMSMPECANIYVQSTDAALAVSVFAYFAAIVIILMLDFFESYVRLAVTIPLISLYLYRVLQIHFCNKLYDNALLKNISCKTSMHAPC